LENPLQQLDKDWRTWDCLHTASLELLLGRKVENISGIINKKKSVPEGNIESESKSWSMRVCVCV